VKIIYPFCLLLFFSACVNKAKTPTDFILSELASPESFFSFSKIDSVNPVLTADSLHFLCPLVNKNIFWAEKDVFNPAAVVRHDTLFLLYRAEDKIGKYAGTSRIGLAWSLDGLHFTKHPTPVFYPANDAYKKLEWEGGCEDPRVIQDEKGTYFMTYTAYDGDKARMLVASSADLYTWIKHGHVFSKADSGKYVDKWTKSGSIVCRYESGTPVAVKLNGKYWMYGGDVNIWAATSDDLINWEPVLYTNGEKSPLSAHRNAAEIGAFKIVFGPREKKFDSDLVEPGPPAMLTKSGIWLIYNSRNIRSTGDTSLAEGTYAAGYAVMDVSDPTKIIQRSDTYFMKPDKPYEITGQVNNVCFLEGLVKYKEKWFLYYGTADSKIAVAVK
jgi:beta-1,2-mannosidase